MVPRSFMSTGAPMASKSVDACSSTRWHPTRGRPRTAAAVLTSSWVITKRKSRFSEPVPSSFSVATTKPSTTSASSSSCVRLGSRTTTS
jgi:hypothetical protein